MEHLYKENIHQIEMVQRMAARLVSDNYSPYNSGFAMLSSLDWRSLEYRRYNARLAMLLKVYHGGVAMLMPSYFEHPSRLTRNMHELSSARYMFLLTITGIPFASVFYFADWAPNKYSCFK